MGVRWASLGVASGCPLGVSAGRPLGGKSEFLIFRYNAIFPVVETPYVEFLTVRVAPESGTLVWGGYGNYPFDVPDLGPRAAYDTLAAIPESSVSATLRGLGGLAGFVMHHRRR